MEAADLTGRDLVAGRRAAVEALKGAREIEKVMVAKGTFKSGTLSEVFALAGKSRIEIDEVPRHELDAIAQGVDHQGVVLVVSPFVYADLDEVTARAGARGRPPALAVLDEVTDPRNLGAILRSADGAGLAGIVIPERRSAPMSTAAIKSAAGAEEHIPVARVGNVVTALERLKEAGFWIVGTGADPGYPDLWKADLSGKLAFVLGSEGRGMRRLVEEQCDLFVRIPMYGSVQSLNVSVAAALLFYELRRRGESR